MEQQHSQLGEHCVLVSFGRRVWLMAIYRRRFSIKAGQQAFC